MVQPIDQQPQVKAQRYRLAATALFALACAVQIFAWLRPDVLLLGIYPAFVILIGAYSCKVVKPFIWPFWLVPSIRY